MISQWHLEIYPTSYLCYACIKNRQTHTKHNKDNGFVHVLSIKFAPPIFMNSHGDFHIYDHFIFMLPLYNNRRTQDNFILWRSSSHPLNLFIGAMILISTAPSYLCYPCIITDARANYSARMFIMMGPSHLYDP